MAAALLAAQAFAAAPSEREKISYLLNQIAYSDATFIRNGQEYSGIEAKAHLQSKLDYAGGRVHTAEEFITYIASKSSATGKPYYVRLPDGTEMEAAQWLHERLAEKETAKR